MIGQLSLFSASTSSFKAMKHLMLLILKNNLSPPTQTFNNLWQMLSRHLWSQQGGRTG
jgi:hypothetical protein